VKDAEAALKDIRMGRITWFEAVLATGYDPNAQLAQIALFNKLVDKFEIILIATRATPRFGARSNRRGRRSGRPAVRL